jgi:hypothetical protein
MTIAVRHAPKREPRNAGAVYGAALDRHQKAERELSRALRKWDKTRAALRRCEKRLDQAMGEMNGS